MRKRLHGEPFKVPGQSTRGVPVGRDAALGCGEGCGEPGGGGNSGAGLELELRLGSGWMEA